MLLYGCAPHNIKLSPMPLLMCMNVWLLLFHLISGLHLIFKSHKFYNGSFPLAYGNQAVFSLYCEETLVTVSFHLTLIFPMQKGRHDKGVTGGVTLM